MTRAHAAPRLLLLLLCLLSPRANAPAQSPARPQPAAQPPATIAPLVRLSLIVSDAAGRSVADVKQEELGVAEDGRPRVIERLAWEELPVTYGLVIDNSRSLTPLLNSVIRAGATVAAGNRPGDETFVLRFVDSDKIEMFQDLTSDAELVRGALSRLYPEGGQTAVIDALALAVRYLVENRKEEAGRRQALVLISDCEDRASVYSQSELIDLLRRANVQVFVVALPGEMQRPEKARRLAETIAAESGGRVFFVKKKKDEAELQAAVEEVGRNLRAQYTLEYRTDNTARDGKFRKVEVKAAGDRKVFARPGYYADGDRPKKK